ncbi:Hypothetical_protein [Hexamita inflata]|uniref:Hypothetical_protein n=1 Tax=Hexamita inflata TaxID=28002 RepID=A0AA86PAL6_9EUKA|nr:Hypothetical protein HINF_LOCUS22984 [Hexamita inflata]
MRQKYTQEQNEAFYLDAAKMYQEAFGVNNCISPSGQVVKEVFFPAYRDRFGYGLGLFTIKEEAKRMRDGVTKFFKARFVEKMERYTDKGIAFEQIMFRVTSEFEPYMLRSDIDNAVLLFKKSLDKQIVQLQNSHVESPRELVSNLNAQIQSQMIRSQARPDAGQSFVGAVARISWTKLHRKSARQVRREEPLSIWCERNSSCVIILIYLNSSGKDQIQRSNLQIILWYSLKHNLAKLLQIANSAGARISRGENTFALGALLAVCSSCVLFVLLACNVLAARKCAVGSEARLDANWTRFQNFSLHLSHTLAMKLNWDLNIKCLNISVRPCAWNQILIFHSQ